MKPGLSVSLGLSLLLGCIAACQPSATIPAAPIQTKVLAPAPTVGKAGIEWVYSAPARLFFARSETTVGQYRACVQEGACGVDSYIPTEKDAGCYFALEDEQLPMNCVTWFGAQAFCAWAGGRLPSDAEWLAEATDGGTRRYPWGNQEISCDLAVWGDGDNIDGCGRNKAWPVCSKPQGNSVSGLCDLSGSVWEWTGTPWGEGEALPVTLGNSWAFDHPQNDGVAIRMGVHPTLGADVDFGFRCVRPATAVQATESTKNGMVRIPAGPFLRGCNPTVDQSCNDDEKPALEVVQDEFWIDRSEVTVADFERCVEAGACPAPVAQSAIPRCNWGDPGKGQHPVNCVEWSQADAYCHWAGKRLPSESEWEKAARGTDGRKFPWGNLPLNCTLAVWRDETNRDGCGRDSTWPVCSKEAGNSPYALCDMGGNVWEWVADWYDPTFYGTAPSTNPFNGTESKARVMRGGAWDCGYDVALRTSERGWVAPTTRPVYAGFRCAQDSAGR